MMTENRGKLAERCRTHHVRRLSVFGSAAREDFEPQRSDVDLLVELEASRSFRYARSLLALHRSLIEPLGREVDLVISRTVLNAVIRKEIEADQRSFYAA